MKKLMTTILMTLMMFCGAMTASAKADENMKILERDYKLVIYIQNLEFQNEKGHEDLRIDDLKIKKVDDGYEAKFTSYRNDEALFDTVVSYTIDKDGDLIEGEPKYFIDDVEVNYWLLAIKCIFE